MTQQARCQARQKRQKSVSIHVEKMQQTSDSSEFNPLWKFLQKSMVYSGINHMKRKRRNSKKFHTNSGGDGYKRRCNQGKLPALTTLWIKPVLSRDQRWLMHQASPEKFVQVCLSSCFVISLISSLRQSGMVDAPSVPRKVCSGLIKVAQNSFQQFSRHRF